MIDSALNCVHTLSAWFAAHPAIFAMVYGWVCGILLTQGAKRFYPLAWVATPDKVKRTSQALATLSAGLFAFFAWPLDTPLQWQSAALCGLACPQVYTALKWALPKCLQRWSWARMAWKRASK